MPLKPCRSEICTACELAGRKCLACQQEEEASDHRCIGCGEVVHRFGRCPECQASEVEDRHEPGGER